MSADVQPTPTSTRALVSYEPTTASQVDWRLEDVSLREPKDDELVIRLVATGICHTDLVFGSLPTPFTTYPKVLGHEGAGYIERAGAKVDVGKPGDAVLLSYSSCATCRDCVDHHPAYCESFAAINYETETDTFVSKEAATPLGLGGLFFGQSSFANYTIVKQASVVNVSSIVRDESELKLFAPLGCGFQTGMGAVDVVAQAGPGDAVVVLGVGGVGLSAIAAAKFNRSHTIIAVDRVKSKLQLALELGATHVIESSDDTDLVAEVKALTQGAGASIVVDTTGNMKVIEAGLALTANRGQLIIIGVPPMDAQLGVHLVTFMQTGKILRGCIEGDVNPAEYIPEMIKRFRAGQFPIDKLVNFYPEFHRALAEMKDGRSVKPVLVW
ncbi:hypothetical protein A1O3_08227 [Capronia epimyces CBS 606.96]|uniref:Enoyl reductase (ER) domain-containing protein n=1 Tax=Capronia epimyces CBS 606.96 TaxID=1182542 RepID=W9XSK2_9EURO|nr:uncharacterized protein A1O3_08227 [Capronia epimyces CBS 606.96]EXJ79941.1 hypothetical protein A1O3_08227 [Capronia epimyces CBS 606.96]